MRRSHHTLALALLLTACATRAAPLAQPAASPSGSRLAALGAELDALFDRVGITPTQWGVTFHSLTHQQAIYSLHGDRFLVPASSQKLLTTAAAAERLGWEYRYTTRLQATAPIESDGTLAGDLVVSSNGDPSINPRHEHRWHIFDAWAASLRAQGLRIVSGRLIGDDNAFDEPGWGVGWAWDNLQYGYGAPVTALQFNENQLDVLVGPGMAPGARAIISTSPLGGGLIIDHGVTTVAAGGETLLDLARVPGSTFLAVRGQIPVGASPVELSASVGSATRFYLTALREALARHGIFVAGDIADVDELSGPRPPATIDLVIDQSPPLLEIIDVANKWSRNIYAETLLLAMAPTNEPATGTRGLTRVRETLTAWNIGPERYLSRDGSGLSRYDFVSANTLTTLLAVLWQHPVHAERMRSTLPVAGVSGTLANRMKGTAAEGRVQAKTGTLSNVRSLSGYLTTSADEAVAFSMIANNFTVPAREVDAVMERAILRLLQLPAASRPRS